MDQVEIETTEESGAIAGESSALVAVAAEADPVTGTVGETPAPDTTAVVAESGPSTNGTADGVMVGAAESPSDVPVAGSPPASESPAPEVTLGGAMVEFRHELSRAMRSAAETERDRMIAAVAGAADGHLAKVRARAGAEADGFRLLADGDIDRIREWSRVETSRIHDEADRRIGARRQQLERHIEQHGSITEREIGGIERAVGDYRAELDRFFARLTSEEDPTELARLAGALPPPPDLEEIGGRARAKALDEFRETGDDDTEAGPEVASDTGDRLAAFSPGEPGPELVGVMAPEGEGSTSEGGTAAEVGAAAGAGTSTEGNGTLQRLRSLAGLSGPKRQD
jgi:hypothetical protein